MYFHFLNAVLGYECQKELTGSKQKYSEVERKVLIMKKMLKLISAALAGYYQTFSSNF